MDLQPSVDVSMKTEVVDRMPELDIVCRTEFFIEVEYLSCELLLLVVFRTERGVHVAAVEDVLVLDTLPLS